MILKTQNKKWDLIIVGGGITGAGIFSMAVRMGFSTILLEQKDFVWGTSSRSSKMIHGGLRYLKTGNLLLTRAAVKERERLLAEAPGLVTPLDFIMPVYRNLGPSKTALETALLMYSAMALKKQYKRYNPKALADRIIYLNRNRLAGGFSFQDAGVDDARLVLRLIHEGMDNGGSAFNYTKVLKINRSKSGRAAGVTAESENGRPFEVEAGCVINATGVWADILHPSFKKRLCLRPLRGSHVIFPSDKLPLTAVITFFHPRDERPVFLSPWEGTVILGTTDVDHKANLNKTPAASPEEIKYLMEGLHFILPNLAVSEKDAVSTMAGIRPVLTRGQSSPSKESREHAVLKDKGVVTVTGGKLTTFRIIAKSALTAAKPYLPKYASPPASAYLFNKFDIPSHKNKFLDRDTQSRLYGRYGTMARTVIDMAPKGKLKHFPGTSTLWAELAFAAKFENVHHLCDLLLRRVRIGLICKRGGAFYLEQIEQVCKPHLDWDKTRWEKEKQSYVETWRHCYSPFTYNRSNSV